ncbi:hypothetical protein SAMN05421736_1441 [Evansella caseinilytica]|uniref:Uncharacterized protein n=1 Tax=Evansella caseinilytica TaxID=1503961 RepID=A0A1H3V425_9BACI|nr:hypothetical protein SAMN05421736_1441 [Evansella caseinilytica]
MLLANHLITYEWVLALSKLNNILAVDDLV